MMKRSVLFLLICFAVLQLSAQQIYDGGFEYWYSPLNPNGWSTWGSVVSQFNSALGDSLGKLAVRDSLNTPGLFPTDSASLRLTVDTFTLPSQSQRTYVGFASLGDASYITSQTYNGIQYGYYPYTQRPDSLIFYYKYIPATAIDDSALVVMTMEHFDSATQTEVYYMATSWLLPPTPDWTLMALPLVYPPQPLQYAIYDTLPPDSIQIIIFAAVSSAPHIGTTLWIDTMHFDASVDIIDTPITSIADIKSLKNITAYPNPANSELYILVQAGEVGSSIRLYNSGGQLVYDAIIDRQRYTIDTRSLPPGIYSMNVSSTDHLTVYKGRITIVHSE